MDLSILASDFDETIAYNGVVTEQTIRALKRFRQSGRKIFLVTGRELNDLLSVFPPAEVFDLIIAENGALIYTPATSEKRVLAPPQHPQLVPALLERGVRPLMIGEVIIATLRVHQATVVETIAEIGANSHAIFNKNSVMILPVGMNKRSGLDMALASVGLSWHNVVGIGDAENDQTFLSTCEWSVAVANALPALKAKVDLVTHAPCGAGVEELIDMILENRLPVDAAAAADGKSPL